MKKKDTQWGGRQIRLALGLTCVMSAVLATAAPRQEAAPQAKPAEIPAQQPIFPKDPAQKRDMEGDIKVGEDYAKEVEKTLKVSKDEKANARLQRVGAVISEIARTNKVTVLYGDKRLSPFGYKFHLVEGADVNAFSIPGGNIYVNEGLMSFIESDDELAAVLGHELSHAAFRHYATMQKDSALINALSIPLLLAAILARNDATYGAMVGAQMASASFMSGWSVEAESAADFGSVQFLARSPYQPVAMLTFMERLARRDIASTHADWTIYTTHPPSELRAHRLLAQIKKLGAPVKRSLVSKSLSSRIQAKDGGFDLWFGDTLIHPFRGPEAEKRAADAVSRVNDFLDTVPEMYHISSTPDGVFSGRGRELFQVTRDDATDLAKSIKDTVLSLRRAVYAVSLDASYSGRSG